MLTKPARQRVLGLLRGHNQEEADKILAILNRVVNQAANRVVSLAPLVVVNLARQEAAVSLVEDILVVKENLIRKSLKKNVKLKRPNNLSRPNAALSNLCAR